MRTDALRAAAAAVLAAAALCLAPAASEAGHRNLCFTGAPATGTDCLGKLLWYMGEEPSGIDVMMYRWSDRRFSDRLVAAHRAGRRVRVIVDRSQYVEYAKTKREVDYIVASGVPVRVTRHRGPTHSKTTILHGRGQVVIATYHPIATTSWEMHFAVQDDTLFRRFVERFERAWFNIDPARGTFRPFVAGMRLPTEAEVEASPPTTCYEDPFPDPKPLADGPTFDVCFTGDQNCQTEQLVPRIDLETASLDVAAYSLSSSWMRDALIRFARRGTPLRLLVDRVEVAENAAVRDALRRIKAVGSNVRINADSSADAARMHLKLFVGASWIAFGSGNFRSGSTVRVRGCQSTAYSENNFVVARDQALRDQSRARFDALWASPDFTTLTP